jgi:hypothetical protein
VPPVQIVEALDELHVRLGLHLEVTPIEQLRPVIPNL